MQAAMWIGNQDDQSRLPIDVKLQLNEVFGASIYLSMVKK